MATQRPVIPSGHVHFHIDKPVDGLRHDAVQNENVHILKGKGISGAKIDGAKPEKTGLKKRTALADLSKAGKPQPPKVVNNLKDKSVLRSAQAPPKKASSGKTPAPLTGILTDEEIRKCQEWAKEGIETASYTGTDMLQHEQEMQEKRIQAEVDMVMSNVHKWAEFAYGMMFPVKTHGPPMEDVTKMELPPEIVLPQPRRSFPEFECDDFLFDFPLPPSRDYEGYGLELKDSDDDVASTC